MRKLALGVLAVVLVALVSLAVLKLVADIDAAALPQRGIVQCVFGINVIGCEFVSLAKDDSIWDVRCNDGARLLLPSSQCLVVPSTPLGSAASNTVTLNPLQTN